MTQIGRPEGTASLLLAELPEQDWDYAIAINLKTTFNVTRAAPPSMLEANYGRVVRQMMSYWFRQIVESAPWWRTCSAY
jgi:hypothetical protein